MQPIGRNQRCPCGSGERYKDCHGSVAAAEQAAASPTSASDPVDILLEATHSLERGDIAQAEKLGSETLLVAPHHPEALRILGRVDFERGEPAAGLAKLLAAARSMQSFPLSAPRQYPIWSDLGFMFTQVLAGMESVFAAGKRTDYSRWLAASRSDTTDATPLVSVVLLASERWDGLRAALQSVRGQTYPNIELVVVGDGAEKGASKELSDLLLDFPIARQAHVAADASEATRINAGVRASTGAFINVLDARDRLAATRAEAFVRQVANRGKAWGFGRVDFIDGDGNALPAEHDPQVARADEAFDGIAETATVGFSLINQHFAAVSAGNLFFSRQLFDRLDGFKDLAHIHAWDFALRALWLEEPVYVPTVEYTHRLRVEQEAPSRAQAESSQVAMFREFYERVCGETAAPNRYAPSLHHWRLHFLKTPFQVGHVLAFKLERLEALGNELIEKRSAVLTGQALPGINLVGFAYGEFGLAENLRALAVACRVGGIPFVVRDVDMRLKTRQADRTLASDVVDAFRYRCSVFCLNPDMLKPVLPLMKPGGGIRRYNVGFWFWELERIPDQWKRAIDSVDEVWVATEFIAEAMRRATSKPVVKVQTPVEVKLSRAYTRADFSLPEARFLFLFSFDFNSFAMRKNPEGTISAFKRAFANGRRDVGLVIKSINGGNNPEKRRELRELIGGDDRIVIIDGFLSRDEVSGLESVVDAYVSLHRAEGLGLGLAESMYLGKPVIATAYSGNLEFMSADNSCLVGYKLVPIAKGQYLYDDERFRWADPDVDQASHYMKQLVDDTEFRERIARRGQSDVRSRFTHANAADLMRSRLTHLGLL